MASNEGGRRSRGGVVYRAVLAALMIAAVVLTAGLAAAQTPSPGQPPSKDQPPGGDEIFVPQSPPQDDVGDQPNEDPPPSSASLSADPTSGNAPLIVTFDGSGSSQVSSYSLTFGDGEATEGKGTPGTFTHTYTTPAPYTAVLTVLSNRRETLTASVTIDVTEVTETPTDPDEDVAGPGNADPNDPDDPNEPGATEEQESPLDVLASDAASAELPNEGTERSLTVASVRDPTELSFSPRHLAETVLIVALLVLLIGFPAEMFNATLLENYEEISGWFNWSWLQRFRTWLSGLPGAVIAVAFAAVGAVIHANLEPHFAFDKGTLALVLGLFLCFLVISMSYDVMRRFHLRKRHELSSRLRAQLIGMVVATVLVLASRLGHFHPGYMYGLFTALAYSAVLHKSHHGRALAFASIRIFVLAVAAWFLWIPVKHLAEEPEASFFILTLDAMLAILWVAGIAAIVFGLAPLHFFYGESVKAWSFWGWLAIWVPGVFMFVYTLLHPERGLYGSSHEASLFSVLALFIGFGAFSIAFWGYFRYRNLRKGSAAQAT